MGVLTIIHLTSEHTPTDQELGAVTQAAYDAAAVQGFKPRMAYAPTLPTPVPPGAVTSTSEMIWTIHFTSEPAVGYRQLAASPVEAARAVCNRLDRRMDQVAHIHPEED